VVADTRIERDADLPATPDSPAAARALLREVLQECGRPDWLDTAELALSELATNVVLHAHTSMHISIRCSGGRLRVEVEDTSAVIPAQRSYGSTSSTGRGLALVAAIAHEHGIVRTDTGKIVWFALGDEPVEADDLDFEALVDAWSDDDLLATEPDRSVRTVTLAGFPPTLWLATAEMHDALLRELALFRTGRNLGIDDLAAADRARFAIRTALDKALASERAQQAARSPLPTGHPAQLQEVPPVLDLDVPVGPDAAADFAVLQDVLDEANRLAGQGLLLTRPSLPEVVAVRDWAAEQVISSVSGQAPMPWAGADAEHFTQQRDQAVREFDYDVAGVVDGDRTAIVVDSQNRILGISEALAAEIGWTVDDLVGRRVVAIVPPRFREAHVAGLTRHLSTGQAHALGVDLELPVLRADGSEMPSSFFIDHDRSRSGAPVYIAYVSPLRDAAG
jgi:PAS domain S-box-containing protein